MTTIDVGNKATNVIANKASASFNIRFNDTWTAESLQAEIIARLEKRRVMIACARVAKRQSIMNWPGASTRAMSFNP